MARAKDLAVLAGLAGLGYMMSKKGGKKEADTGGDSNPTRAARPESTETREAPLDNTNYSNEGRGAAPNMNVKPRSLTPPAAAVTDTAEDTAPATTPMASTANRTDQLTGLSRAVKRESKTKQFAQDVPYQESAQKTDAMAVASRAARAADAKRRAAKQSAYKSGGTVSSASKRADGIATKGKTRGKIC